MPLPSEFATTRDALRRVAAHVLARRRHAVTGRFGLRVAPGGFATPAFGDGPEVVRVARGALVRETASGAGYVGLPGATMRDLAVFAGVDLDAEFSVGRDTPEVGRVDEPLLVDPQSSAVLADWYAVGAQALDDVLERLPSGAEPAVVQLWPEHFDVGTHVGVGGGERCNLGVSPGDGYSNEPYAYVGPWGDARPGNAGYWNAPFGAVLRWSEVGAGPGAVGELSQFLLDGLGRLGAPPRA